MKRSGPQAHLKLVLAVASLLLAAPGCSLLLDDDANPAGSDAGELDGSPGADASGSDANSADAMLNTDDYRFPYTCDSDTIALYHFDMLAVLADQCNSNDFPPGTGIRSEPGPSGFNQAAAPQSGNPPTAPLAANSPTFTVDAWVYIDAQTGRVLRLGDTALTTNTLTVDVFGNGSEVDLSVQSPSTGAGYVFTVPLNTWVHLRVVWDESLLTVYRDGQCVGTSNPGIVVSVLLESLQVVPTGDHIVDEVRISSSARLIPGQVCPP